MALLHEREINDRFNEPISITESQEAFNEYTSTFIQRHPKYGLKSYSPGASWKTVRKPLPDGLVKQHLNGDKAVGVVSQWYCRYGVIDIDDRDKSAAEDIRGALGFDTSNSLLFTSESPNSYHLYFRPSLNGEPPPVKRFNRVLKSEAASRCVEIYPQPNRVFRLPFGRHQELATPAGHLLTQRELLDEFLKLKPFDISGFEPQREFEWLGAVGQGLVLSTASGFMAEAQNLFEYGLQGSSTRNDSQWKVICFLYRACNMPPEQVVREVYKWIKTKHNGFSKDMAKGADAQIKREIEWQVRWVYTNSHLERKYPDKVHNSHNGYIAKPDIPEIIEAAGGSIPRSRFLYNLVRYTYPRRHRQFISIHRNIFEGWGVKNTYLGYLDEFEKKRLVQRGSAYSVGRFAKSVRLNWDYKTTGAVLIEGRAVDTFEDAVKLTHKPAEFRELLQAKGAERTRALKAVQAIYR